MVPSSVNVQKIMKQSMWEGGDANEGVIWVGMMQKSAGVPEVSLQKSSYSS